MSAPLKNSQRGMPVRILKVNMSVDPVMGGGTAERTMQLAKALVELGHECTVLTLDIGLSDEFKKHVRRTGIQAVYLPCLAKRFYLPAPDLRAIARAVRQADIVHLMGHWTAINVLVFSFCRKYRKPYVVCPAGALPAFGRSRQIKHLYNRIVGYRMIRSASAWVAVTPAELNGFRDYGVAPEKVTVIPNGVSADDFVDADGDAFRKRMGITGPVLLFMGRLNPIKGPDLLLKAFLQVHSRFPEWNLIFAGPDGGLLEELKALAARNAKVHFLGYTGGADKSQVYHAADLLAIPSRQEAMSIVVLEAGIASTPVLITDQCGFDEVEQVGGGRVVAASIDGLARGLEGILGGEELVRMGQRLNEYVRANFEWRRAAARYIELYEDVLSAS